VDGGSNGGAAVEADEGDRRQTVPPSMAADAALAWAENEAALAAAEAGLLPPPPRHVESDSREGGGGSGKGGRIDGDTPRGRIPAGFRVGGGVAHHDDDDHEPRRVFFAEDPEGAAVAKAAAAAAAAASGAPEHEAQGVAKRRSFLLDELSRAAAESIGRGGSQRASLRRTTTNAEVEAAKTAAQDERRREERRERRASRGASAARDERASRGDGWGGECGGGGDGYDDDYDSDEEVERAALVAGLRRVLGGQARSLPGEAGALDSGVVAAAPASTLTAALAAFESASLPAVTQVATSAEVIKGGVLGRGRYACVYSGIWSPPCAVDPSSSSSSSSSSPAAPLARQAVAVAVKEFMFAEGRARAPISLVRLFHQEALILHGLSHPKARPDPEP
jgi:hypothetical protein